MRNVKKRHILFALAASAILAGCDTTEVRQDQTFNPPTISSLDNINI